MQRRSRNIRRVREKKLHLVYQLPGDSVLRSRSVSYSRLSKGVLIAFSGFLALIFFTLLEASRAADYGYDAENEALSLEWAEEERGENRAAFRREMLLALDQVERLVENQKEIRLLLGNTDRRIAADLDWMETALGSLEEMRQVDGPRSSGQFGPGAYLVRRLVVHQELLDSAGEFSGRYRAMFGALPHRWPLDRENLQVNSPYGWRRPPFYRLSKKLKFHRGIDLDADRGDPVVAAAAGSVRRATNNAGGYGKLVHLKHADGFETLYAHLNRIHVRKGDHIRAGQLIGRAGSTGHSTGPHLHYEVRRDGQAVDPARYLAL